jgi:hypothetical protein
MAYPYGGINAISLGTSAGTLNQGVQTVAIGYGTGYENQGNNSIAIGASSGAYNQGSENVAIGFGAGNNNQQVSAIAIGGGAGNSYQQQSAVAIGESAGYCDQQALAIAIGFESGKLSQQVNAIAIGETAGEFYQGQYAIAIGNQAGQNIQGQYAIAIGNQAGQNDQHSNSIVINATGATLNSQTSSAAYIAPIRNVTQTSTLGYDTTTKEVTYYDTGSFINATNTTDSNVYYPVFVNAAGSLATPRVTTTTSYLSYVPSTGTLTAQVMNAASDIRIKQEIQQLTIEYSKNLLKKLNPVEYKFINDPTKKRFGLIAQEIDETFKGENLGLHYKQSGPDGEERQFLSYLELISPIIKVVNNLVEDINTMREEVKLLKSQLNK